MQSQQAFSPVSGDGWLFPWALLSWAGFLGWDHFACPQGGLKGWRSPLQPCLVAWCGRWSLFTVVHWHHIWVSGYVITGIVAFLMCIQAKQLLLSFVPVCL
ncbi:DUF1097 domain-containing protein [Escherichia coli]